MSILSRLSKLEAQTSTGEDIFVTVGDPSRCFTGEAAIEYSRKEKAAGRLKNGLECGGHTIYLPRDLMPLNYQWIEETIDTGYIFPMEEAGESE